MDCCFVNGDAAVETESNHVDADSSAVDIHLAGGYNRRGLDELGENIGSKQAVQRYDCQASHTK